MRGLGLVAVMVAAIACVFSIILKLAGDAHIGSLSTVSFWRFTVVALLFAVVFILYGSDGAK